MVSKINGNENEHIPIRQNERKSILYLNGMTSSFIQIFPQGITPKDNGSQKLIHKPQNHRWISHCKQQSLKYGKLKKEAFINTSDVHITIQGMFMMYEPTFHSPSPNYLFYREIFLPKLLCRVGDHSQLNMFKVLRQAYLRYCSLSTGFCSSKLQR